MVPSRSLKDVLERASAIAGTDLTLSLKSKPDPIEEIEQIRDSLPNQQTRKRFDTEIEKQTKRATKETAGQRAYRHRRSNQRMLAKLKKRLKDAGIANPEPTLIPAHLFEQTQHIIADDTGWAAKYYSRLCSHKIGVSLCHRAALCYDENNQPRYTYIGKSRDALRARYVLAMGLLLLGLSASTGRKRHGWMRIVKAIPLAAFQVALRDPFTGKQPHRNTLDGCHREVPKIINAHTGKAKPAVSDGRVGYLTALAAVGLFYQRQAKWREGDNPADQKGWSDIRSEEMAGESHNGLFTSLNRYWIVADRFTDPKDAEKRATLFVAWLASAAYPEPVDYATLQANTEQIPVAREAPS